MTIEALVMGGGLRGPLPRARPQRCGTTPRGTGHPAPAISRYVPKTTRRITAPDRIGPVTVEEVLMGGL
ncbi:hypothetical protein [Nocardiopsis trehalosi]|uniref:hypothetical protein n=1 Tax=Nocardiopsis trehalosi TaxID=109329 RepID=UPI000830E139|nr:hypothetical protein [Nocardiopsis trehalosi]